MTDPKDIALAMVALKHAMDKLSPAQTALRKDGQQQLHPKEVVAAVSPIDGSVLGTITRTNPAKKARVEDEAALMAWMAEHKPEALLDVDTVEGTQDEVLTVLKEHAPHLVGSTVVIASWAGNEVLKQSEKTGNPVAPGIVVEKPIGTVMVLPDKEAGDAIEAVIRAGHVALDGTVRKMLPPAAEAA